MKPHVDVLKIYQLLNTRNVRFDKYIIVEYIIDEYT